MKKTTSILVLVAAISGAAFPSVTLAETAEQPVSLYERLGGYNAIVAVVDDLVPRLAADEKLGRFWAHRGDDGIAREKQLIVDFIANQAGGPLYYRGRDMNLSHVGMRIDEEDWQRMMKHLDATLDKFQLADRERQDVIAFMERTRKDIVERP